MLSFIKGIGNALGLRRPSSSSAGSATAGSVSSPKPARGEQDQKLQQQKTAIKTRRVPAGDDGATNSEQQQQQQSKSVRFSGQVDEENVAVQQSPPPRPPPPKKLQSTTARTSIHAQEDYDNIQGHPNDSTTAEESPMTPAPPASELSITNCSDCCEHNEESLNTTDFSEHLNSEHYPSLELSNQQGVRHVTSNFDSLPYQGAHWLMQQQQIDEEQRLIDMRQLQEEQQAEELRLYMEELDVHESMKLDDGAADVSCCQLVRPIPVEHSEHPVDNQSVESYDNELSWYRSEEEKAAVTIQRMMKGHCVRSKLERQKTAAVKIQAHFRGFLTRKRIHEAQMKPSNHLDSPTSAEQANFLKSNATTEAAEHCCSTMQAMRVIQSSDSFYDLCACCCRADSQPASSMKLSPLDPEGFVSYLKPYERIRLT